MYSLTEYHLNHNVSPLFVEPVAVYFDESTSNDTLVYSITLVDGASNKYYIYTTKNEIRDKIKDCIAINDVTTFNAMELVCINESMFNEDSEVFGKDDATRVKAFQDAIKSVYTYSNGSELGIR